MNFQVSSGLSVTQEMKIRTKSNHLNNEQMLQQQLHHQ